MGDKKDMNAQLEVLRRQAADLVRELHARRLALPAGVLLIAIVAAMVLLPKGGTPPSPPTPTGVAGVTAETPKVEVARVSLISASSIDEDIPLSNSSNPFTGKNDYTCTRVGSGEPKVLNCQIGDVLVRVICPESEEPQGACANKSGASGSTGSDASSSGAGSGSGTSGSGTGGSGGGSTGTSGETKYYTWAVTVKIDLKTYKDKVVGSQLPTSDNPLAIFAGVNTDGGAVFLGASGVAVTGTPVDPNFNRFDLKKGQTATITDLDGKKHKLTVVSIKKVEKT